MLSGESVVENSAPTIGTPLLDVVVNSNALPRLIDLQNLFVDDNDAATITLESNSDSNVVTPYLADGQLLLEFSGTLGSSVVTLRATKLPTIKRMTSINTQ